MPSILFWRCDVTFPKRPGQVYPLVQISLHPVQLSAGSAISSLLGRFLSPGKSSFSCWEENRCCGLVMLWSPKVQRPCATSLVPHITPLAHPRADCEAAGPQLCCSQSCGQTRRSSGTLSRLLFSPQNPRFPGNLQMSDRQLDEAGENDVNNL